MGANAPATEYYDPSAYWQSQSTAGGYGTSTAAWTGYDQTATTTGQPDYAAYYQQQAVAHIQQQNALAAQQHQQTQQSQQHEATGGDENFEDPYELIGTWTMRPTPFL